MKCVETVQAVGAVLCHDLTQIIPGITKDARFRKGHVVTEADIPILLSMGKEHLYVWEPTPGTLHEDEGAARLAALCGTERMTHSAAKEGKIELFAAEDGLFLADVPRLAAVNLQDEVMIATRHSHSAVRKGDKLAGTRVIPLVIKEETLANAERAAGDAPLLSLLPYRRKTAAIITTGGEVFRGRIHDQFTPIVEQKLAELGVTVLSRVLCDDDPDEIAAAIAAAVAAHVDLVLCTGGMSVDPDDRTPLAIRQSGADIVSYGAPVLPGAMFLLGYFGDGTPICGLPGCVMYAKATVFDLILPRLLADCPVTRGDLAALGHGGLCLNCPVCHYPDCSFGKGV